MPLLASYWRTSRAPRYSLLYALPLLVFYQVLAAVIPAGSHGALRNGADVLLQGLFVALAGSQGPLVFMTCLVGLGLWLVWKDMRANGSRLTPEVFALMLGESAVLALAFGVVVGGITARLLGPVAPLAIPGAESLDWWTKLMLSLGAGLYEELLFRVALVALLAHTGRHLLGWQPGTAGAVATVIGALLFSAFHYVGPYADRLEPYSFVYRTVGGMFFSALYLSRGFGITAWTHALYDVLVLAR